MRLIKDCATVIAALLIAALAASAFVALVAPEKVSEDIIVPLSRVLE